MVAELSSPYVDCLSIFVTHYSGGEGLRNQRFLENVKKLGLNGDKLTRVGFEPEASMETQSYSIKIF